MLDPAATTERAPERFRARFETTKGAFVIEVHREWAPLGADRFYNLVKSGFYDDTAFFRVVPGFVVQFGISGDPAVSAAWRDARIKDDPVRQSNRAGHVSYAKTGIPDSRTTQVFINLADNGRLDGMGFAPFGVVVNGMDAVRSLNSLYGNEPTAKQGEIAAKGNGYLKQAFPGLDYVVRATIAE